MTATPIYPLHATLARLAGPTQIKTNHEAAFPTASSGDRLFLAQHEFGPFMVLVAPSYEAAHDEMIDSMKTIPEDELYEAYEMESHEEYESVVLTGDFEAWDLNEAYQYQSNATGTGIVNVGHYVTLTEISWKGWGQAHTMTTLVGHSELTFQFGCVECERMECRCEEEAARELMLLGDDGTMDTVFTCEQCEEEVRFDSMAEHRDEDGELQASGFIYAHDSHVDECEGPSRQSRGL